MLRVWSKLRRLRARYGSYNLELASYPGLLLKDSYWRWPTRNLAGNAIDFFVQVLGLSFNDATRQITSA